jgi:hypothetical protein
MALTEQESQAAGAAPECLVCPLCMGVAALRQARPEVMEHLVKAGAELLEAFRALMEPPAGERARAGGLQRIDIG